MNSKKIILIVEDDAVLLKNLAAFFKDAGFGVLQAVDGEAGFKTAVEERPDIILLDILLPKMDGISVLKKLRQEHQALRMPIILLTNIEPSDSVMQDIIQTEPAYYMVKKDWKLADILEKVRESLEKSSS